jgi:uncharacterized membrane protein
MISPFIFAFLSPLLYALVNVLDKHVISQKAKSVFGYVALVGLVNIILCLIIAAFLDWKNIGMHQLWFPIISGIFEGATVYLYYYILNKENASDMIGIVYLYPVLIAIAAFLFLGETISLGGYVGAGLSICGVLLLSVQLHKRAEISWYWFAIPVILTAGFEFFIKLSTENIPPVHGFVINSMVLGLLLLFPLCKQQHRQKMIQDLKIVHFTVIIEALTLAGVLTLFFAMNGLPATIVSSIACLQPVLVLVFEHIAHTANLTPMKGKNVWTKILAICLVVIGCVLLYRA